MRRDLLHAPGAAGPVAVVEVQLAALENEGTEAVLKKTRKVSKG